MTSHSFTLFDTAIGRCALVWSEHGVAGLQLPEADDAGTCACLRRRFPEACEAPPPSFAQQALEAVIALLDGEARDLSFIELDMDGVSSFERQVYNIARGIPPGATRSYGEIAEDLGDIAEARAVGQALGRNPFAIIVPCHRVLGAGGKVGGFSAEGGVETKLRILTIEKARTNEAPSLFDSLPLAARRPSRQNKPPHGITS